MRLSPSDVGWTGVDDGGDDNEDEEEDEEEDDDEDVDAVEGVIVPTFAVAEVEFMGWMGGGRQSSERMNSEIETMDGWSATILRTAKILVSFVGIAAEIRGVSG